MTVINITKDGQPVNVEKIIVLAEIIRKFSGGVYERSKIETA